MQILSGGRFRLGLGAGENLNEHVVGQRWPMVGERHELLEEAVEIIATLFDGEAPAAFDAASRYVTPDDVADGIACGPDAQTHVDAVKPYLDAGFDEVALVQIGADAQADFCAWAERELLPALHSL